jgi:hypothetical protein
MAEFENEEEIALLLAKHLDLPNDKTIDFSKISIANKELMRVLRKRKRRVDDTRRRPDIRRLIPSAKIVAKTARAVENRRRTLSKEVQSALPAALSPESVATHTNMLNTDLLTLGAVIPGCDPRSDPPGLVMSKGSGFIAVSIFN